jgi:alkylated DNA nucleotide flippase Atl1/uncharacterized protein YndB with AHSA1/START domain
VATYGQIAALADLPGHARQVGYALNAMPHDGLAPWHRVINAQGKISRRATPGYEFIQRGLLEAEGVRFGPDGRISLKRFGWEPGTRRKKSAAREKTPHQDSTRRRGARSMATKLGPPESKRISDDAVKAKTGKTWPQWFRILDRAGGKEMSHKETVAWIKARHPKVSGWWLQMLTVGYEQNRGLRDKHQKPEGYEVSGSRTIATSVGKAYKAWKEKRSRSRWLSGEEIEIRKATSNKSLRITWSDGKSSVNVNLYSKGSNRTQVAVQHGKLRNATQAARMKSYWSRKLDGLKELLES